MWGIGLVVYVGNRASGLCGEYGYWFMWGIGLSGLCGIGLVVYVE